MQKCWYACYLRENVMEIAFIAIAMSHNSDIGRLANLEKLVVTARAANLVNQG